MTGVTGLTRTWLHTILWMQGVMENRYHPWYGCDRCDTDVVTYRTVIAGYDGEQALPVVRGVTGVTLTWLRSVL